MDFSDANDNSRGMAVYEYASDTLKYIDWAECPKYVRANLSDVLKSPKKLLKSDARVKVDVDTDLTFEENLELKATLLEKYGLRELAFEEQKVELPEVSDAEKEVNEMNLGSLSEVIVELLKRIKSDKIDSEKLANIYRSL